MADDPPILDEEAERRLSWWLVLAVLATLTAVKPLGSIPYVGAIAFTFAAVLQLYLPLWRIDTLKLGHDFIGLHLKAWRRDLKIVLVLVLVTFPPYVVLHHLFRIYSHDWALALGLEQLAVYLPRPATTSFAEWWDQITLPVGVVGWLGAAYWFLKTVATHLLGVALPEETFYRGYLQPRLETKWKPQHAVFGVKIGLAAVVASALFALGHWLGEWNPLRLGPFLPGLVFAWQRNATGSVAGAITYHAACNIMGEVLFKLYE